MRGIVSEQFVVVSLTVSSSEEKQGNGSSVFAPFSLKMIIYMNTSLML